MESVLIVSCNDKSIEFFREMLKMADVRHAAVADSCANARERLFGGEFDLVIINSPLRDGTGESLSKEIASSGVSQVILVVRSEYFDELSLSTESAGVLIVAKPVNRSLFWSALKLAKASVGRVKLIHEENLRLKQELENIGVVSRAKMILMSYLSLSEGDAHRYIEKQAMDKRVTKREIAEGILKIYEN